MIERSQTTQPSPVDFSDQHLNRSTDTSSAIAAAGPTHTIRILVVEDMTELADLYRETLSLHGFEVTVAYDGAAALRCLTDSIFNLALVDIDLPDLCGFEVVERARAAGCLRGTRVVFCSGGYQEERQARSLEFPGSSFMSKPFTIKKLLTTVSDALS